MLLVARDKQQGSWNYENSVSLLALFEFR